VEARRRRARKEEDDEEEEDNDSFMMKTRRAFLWTACGCNGGRGGWVDESTKKAKAKEATVSQPGALW
jgi:hypothetical protein